MNIDIIYIQLLLFGYGYKSNTDRILNVRTRIRSDLNPPKRIRTRIRTDNIRTFYTPTRMPSALALFGYDYKPLMDGNKPKSHTNASIISGLFETPLSLQSAKQREPRFSRTRLRRRVSQKRDPFPPVPFFLAPTSSSPRAASARPPADAASCPLPARSGPPPPASRSAPSCPPLTSPPSGSAVSCPPLPPELCRRPCRTSETGRLRRGCG